MDSRYAHYCVADPVFYDSPARSDALGGELRQASRAAPAGWKRAERGDWVALQPEHVRLPAQGWKVHVSTRLERAEEVLDRVWEHCVGRALTFKFVRSRPLLLLRNAKYADRGDSGKFVTVYPVGDAQLEVVLGELGKLLEGEVGPDVLSDLRCGAAPVHVRYGGFADRRRLGAGGEWEPAIENEEGELVADRRDPVFAPPAWVTLPACLEPHVAARAAHTVDELGYRLDAALHFSNAGGVYLGTDPRTDERVVLKEARPHAGLSPDGSDAVVRLWREWEMLAHLAGLDAVPAARDLLNVGGHRFLVRDFVEGTSLSATLAERHPLVRPRLSPAEASDHVVWVVDVHRKLGRAVAAAHDRGVVLGDLHPSNVLVGPDARVSLIDLEAATHVSEASRPRIGAPGFMAPPTVAGFDIDRYALACIGLFLFMPLTPLVALDPGKAERLSGEIAGLFPAPDGFLRNAVATIEAAHGDTVAREPSSRSPSALLEPDVPPLEARDSMVAAILASATPTRDDRLFPGDVDQFIPGGGLNLAHGAAGVLYALQCAGADRRPEYERWLVDRVRATVEDIPLGFYNGLHGIAHVLGRLGRPAEARELVDVAGDRLAAQPVELGSDLYGGLAGIGLNLLHLSESQGTGSLGEEAERIGESLADRLGDETAVDRVSGADHGWAGLMHGASGPALLFVRLFERTADPGWLDRAVRALRQDLRRCVTLPGGRLEVNEGWRTLPYLAEGSAGIGMVLRAYLVHRHDERFERARLAIREAARGQFCIQAGLFAGRAGMFLALSPPDAAGAVPRDPEVDAHVRRLAWHAVGYQGHLAFPGDGLLRLSMDLATGTAGVLLSLSAAGRGYAAHLPFLGGTGVARPAVSDPAVTFEGR